MTASSYNLNQCWPFISDTLCHSYEGYFTGNIPNTYIRCEFDDYWLKIAATSLGSNELNNWYLPSSTMDSLPHSNDICAMAVFSFDFPCVGDQLYDYSL